MFGFTHEAPMRLRVPYILINVEKGARVLVRLYFPPLQQREHFPNLLVPRKAIGSQTRIMEEATSILNRLPT
jgi:hypothetical protein